MNKCECCHIDKPIAGVACSALGPFSLSYCHDCAEKGAEPKDMILWLIDDLGGLENIVPELVNGVTYFENGEYHPMKSLVEKLPKGKNK